MTLPYGSTQSSARTYVHEYLIENWHLFDAGEEIQFELAQFLTPILWEAIGEVVIAARAAMSWLRENTHGEFMKWLSPVGFPVYQAYTKADLCEVTTQLNGGIRLALRDYEASNTPDNRTQKNGVAPNFIHSVDASHLVRTVNACDLQGYAMIHDDFGTHAAHGDRLYRAIRLTFKEMYEGKDILTDWAEQVGANKETLPLPGNYDIRNILKSTYFFA